jgi:murein L,D-transpeptidase YafK
MFHVRLISWILIVLSCFVWDSAIAQARMATQALADKSDGVVVFFDVHNQEVARFEASFGQGRGHKKREGDLKTPEGDYWLRPARPSNEWDWFMPIDYPNEKDVSRAVQEGRDPGSLGGAIGLHAAGSSVVRNIRQSFGENWTFGCIAVSNESMRQIRIMVPRPIILRIQP